ncbi:phosphatase PAP2 family protein [Streptomyces hainanensis]|uniref:Inositol phosphorylceramide synthase n=1 Tax=Streptomyces hainanensis TaxID=402648 RepID=A0A4R4THF2_9ACTN|nr:phosphatase PAP2 family protein [Streptomyces hainanensis]TDC76980.1 inositol phosphorylceramide synthase [Streptomyces hainanensis]
MRSTAVLKRVLTARNREGAARSARPPLVRELPLIVALYLAYKFGRRAANGQFAEARDNAEWVWELERALRLPGEKLVQDLLLHSETVIRFVNVYYATVHFPAIVVFLVWMYWRRPGHFVWVRWVLTWLTGAALVLHLLFPLAPPRLFRPSRMMDTGVVYGPAVYDKPAADSMANQFAAMPSLHVGWAVFIAVALIVATRSRWRWLWLLHPLITVTAVVGTGHHYWMDGLVACAILAVVLAVLRPPRGAPRPSAPAARNPASADGPGPDPGTDAQGTGETALDARDGRASPSDLARRDG